MTRKGPTGSRIGLAAALLCVLGGASTGCNAVKARDPVFRNAIRDRVERRNAYASPDGPWTGVLDREGLAELAGSDPAAASAQLEESLAARPEPGGALALGELSYRAGLRRQDRDPEIAVAWYRDGAALAALAIRDSDGGDPGAAVALHNRSVARMVRIAQQAGRTHEGGWQRVLAEAGVNLGSPTPDLAPARFADLDLVEDIRVTGMDHTYTTTGLGVPLVVHRTVRPTTSPDPLDRFHPKELRIAASAVVVPGEGGLRDRGWRARPSTLALFDPFDDRALRLGSRVVPLAGDRTTPLALQVAQGSLPTLEFAGLFDSDFRRPGVEAGLYLLRPYKPRKIPVILVHGLFSSPRAFVQTMNELENDPDISNHFQFWVFLYPTGLPIPASSMEFRASLNRVRDSLDPNRVDPAMDRMVVIGHSMGGLLAKMMVQDSGTTLWDAAFSRPVDQLKASPATLKLLDDALIYRPVPFVKRAVFIATPHRGSPIADQLFGRTIAALIQGNTAMTRISHELVQDNGPTYIAPELRRMPLNAIGNLRTDSPILLALDRIPIDPRVPYHSIIPQVGGVLPTDGVVEYDSSHLEGAESEKIIPGTHFAQQHPDVTEELRRILRIHFASNP